MSLANPAYIQVKGAEQPVGHTRDLSANDRVATGGMLAKLINLGSDIIAAAVAGVHAALAGNAAVAFPGPFTNPAQPRNVTCTFAASYDGGNITVTGTDQFDQDQTETIVANAGNTVAGVKIFKTVTSAVRSTTGATANTVSIGWGNKIGINHNGTALPLTSSLGQLFVTGVGELGTFDATYHGVTPTNNPNGARDYTALVNL